MSGPPPARIADVNALLAGVTFTPAANFNSNFTIATSVTDGVAAAITGTKAMTGVAVNDAPVNTVPGPQTVAGGATLVLGGASAISIADVDAGATVQVQLAATGGTITLNGIAGLTFASGDGVSDAAMTFTGSIAAINAALDGLAFATTTGFTGAGSLQIVTDDLGGTGAGGALADTDTVAISVTDGTPPTLSSFSSSTAAGTYGVGASINLTATMDEAVQAGSQITVTLDTGDTVVLTAAANGTTLTGTYVVGAGDNSADLNIASFVIDSVFDISGNAMVSTTIPAGQNLADNEAIVVDTTAPAAPAAPDLIAASDSGVSNSDDVTSDNTPTVHGNR